MNTNYWPLTSNTSINNDKYEVSQETEAFTDNQPASPSLLHESCCTIGQNQCSTIDILGTGCAAALGGANLTSGLMLAKAKAAGTCGPLGLLFVGTALVSLAGLRVMTFFFPCDIPSDTENLAGSAPVTTSPDNSDQDAFELEKVVTSAPTAMDV